MNTTAAAIARPFRIETYDWTTAKWDTVATFADRREAHDHYRTLVTVSAGNYSLRTAR